MQSRFSLTMPARLWICVSLLLVTLAGCGTPAAAPTPTAARVVNVVTAAMRARLDELKEKIISGEIVVSGK